PRLDDLGRQANDLHELAVAQLAGDGPEDPRAAGILLVVDQHDRVAVEFDVGAIAPPRLVPRPDDDAADHIPRLDVAAGRGLLHAGDDRVAQARGAPLVSRSAAAENLDAHHFLGPRVIRHVEPRLHLDHRTNITF